MDKVIINHIDYDFNGYERIIRAIAQKYPFVSVESIGKSVFGREIKMLKIGNAADYILYTAAIHGSERITATLLLKYIAELCYAFASGGRIADIDARQALLGKGLLFVPLVNPDGCEISLKGALGCGNRAGQIYKLCGGDFTHWNANARGVDLNHNFDADWASVKERERSQGYFGPGPTRYGGPFPESEPETVALVNLCKKVNIRYVMCLHTQGEVIYWDFGGIKNEKAQKMAEVFSAVSGYALDVPTALAIGGGFKDWFIEAFHRPGFTIELGKGKNPLPASKGEEIYSQIKEMFTISLLM